MLYDEEGNVYVEPPLLPDVHLFWIVSDYRRMYYENGKLALRNEKLLKSLRPQNKWKPSYEQMEALDNALSLAKNCGEESAFDLRILYEQLKKLYKKSRV